MISLNFPSKTPLVRETENTIANIPRVASYCIKWLEVEKVYYIIARRFTTKLSNLSERMENKELVEMLIHREPYIHAFTETSRRTINSNINSPYNYSVLLICLSLALVSFQSTHRVHYPAIILTESVDS